MAICPSCGEENPDRFRLCGFCGTPLRSRARPRVRKTVTIVFSDLVGLDRHRRAPRLGIAPRGHVALLRRHARGARTPRRHGGEVHRRRRDGRVRPPAACTRTTRCGPSEPRPRCSAALAGLNAELDARFGVTLANRTGVNTGEVVAGDPAAGQRLVTGDAVNVAARLEQAAGTDEVLIGPLTRDLVEAVADLEPVEPLTLKGKSEPMPAFRLAGVRAASAAPAAASPLVGAGRGAGDPPRGARCRRHLRLGRLVRSSPRRAPASRAWSPSSSAACPPARDRDARPLPLLRPGHHLLAHRRGAPRGCGHARRRPARPGPLEARRAGERRHGRLGACCGCGRPHRRGVSDRRALLRPPPGAHEHRRGRATRRHVRGPALGRADDARTGRPPRRRAGAAPAPLHGPRRARETTATAGPRSRAAPPSSSTGSRPTRRRSSQPAWPGARCRPQRSGRSSRPQAGTRSSSSRCWR